MCAKKVCYMSFHLNIRHRHSFDFQFVAVVTVAYFFLHSQLETAVFGAISVPKNKNNDSKQEMSAGFSMKIHKFELHFAVVQILAHYSITSAKTAAFLWKSKVGYFFFFFFFHADNIFAHLKTETNVSVASHAELKR